MNESIHSTPLHSLVSSLGHLYISFTGATTRIRTENRPEAADVIYASWHSQLAFMLYVLRNRDISGLVSRSRDGEYAARLLRKFGFNTVRGSTSRAAAQSLMELIDRGRRGFPLAITPDGPKGPNRKVQQGVIYLAQKTGMAIMPVGVRLSSKLTFNSLDNFEFPLPFGKATVVYGAPIKVAEGDHLEAKAAELEAALNAIVDSRE